MKFKLPAACVAATLAAAASIPVWAQDLQPRTFNAVGTWNFLTNWQKMEQPFWTEDLPKATGGKLKGNIKSITEVNLKGTEVVRLLKQGVFDFAAALPIYVEDGGAIIEASDIAGVARDFKMGREIVNAWLPEMQKAMARNGATMRGSIPRVFLRFTTRTSPRSLRAFRCSTSSRRHGAAASRRAPIPTTPATPRRPARRRRRCSCRCSRPTRPAIYGQNNRTTRSRPSA